MSFSNNGSPGDDLRSQLTLRSQYKSRRQRRSSGVHHCCATFSHYRKCSKDMPGSPHTKHKHISSAIYAFAIRRLGISAFSSLPTDGPDTEAARTIFTRAVPFLTDLKSRMVLTTIDEVITNLWPNLEGVSPRVPVQSRLPAHVATPTLPVIVAADGDCPNRLVSAFTTVPHGAHRCSAQRDCPPHVFRYRRAVHQAQTRLLEARFLRRSSPGHSPQCPGRLCGRDRGSSAPRSRVLGYVSEDPRGQDHQ